MKEHQPLFVYDRDGTLQTLSAVVRAHMKVHFGQATPSLQEFKAQYGPTAMFPGMADLVRYTATLGNNILISGGKPEDCCPELQALRPFFQDWTFKNKIVPWGTLPNNLPKDHALIVQELVKNVKPNRVVVIGDSLEEYMMACRFAYYMKEMLPLSQQGPAPAVVTFLRPGLEQDTQMDSVVPVFSVQSATQMKHIMEQLFAPKPNGKIFPTRKEL